jgi:peptidyl-prolyl cis-trans isomerase C
MVICLAQITAATKHQKSLEQENTMQTTGTGGCGSSTCGCASKETAESVPLTTGSRPTLATINDVPLHKSGDRPDDATLRQRAHAEILRQEAMHCGLLASTDVATDDGIQSEAATIAIEQLLERELSVPEPDETACHRYFDANQSKFQSGERVQVRHILFAVTPGVDVTLLRKRAEAALLDTRCRDAVAPDQFGNLARELSNCPSGADGGGLGWLATADCAREFARELFGHSEVGVLPRLVHSRFGLHVVEVQARQLGTPLSYESVRGYVKQALQQQTYIAALRQYLQLLAASSVICGVDINATDSPLVQ